MSTAPEAPITSEVKVHHHAGLPYLGVATALMQDLPAAILRLGSGYDIVATTLLGTPTYIIVGAAAIAEVLIHQAKSAARLGKFQRAFNYFGEQPVLGGGVLGAEPAEWRWQRRDLSPHFGRGKMAAYEATIAQITAEVCSTWQDGETRDLLIDLQQITVRVILEVLFAESDPDAVQAARRTFNSSSKQMGKRGVSLSLPHFIPTPANRELSRALREMDKIIYAQIARHADGQQPGILGHILTSIASDSRWTKRHIRDNVAGVIVAGYETTATVLTWAANYLALDPEWQSQIAAASDTDRAMAVFRETLRLRPAVPMISREVTAPLTIGELTMQVGSQLLISNLVNHADPRYFPEPQRFNPERWLDEGSQHLPPAAYMPFGTGWHLCLGKYLAELEGGIVLSQLLKEWQLLPTHPSLPAGHFQGSWRPTRSRFVVKRRRKLSAGQRQQPTTMQPPIVIAHPN